jgi:hypothetical protein
MLIRDLTRSPIVRPNVCNGFCWIHAPLMRGQSRRKSHIPLPCPSQRDAVYAPPRSPFLYDSVLTRAWPFVTFTPNCLALAMISMRFRAETACEILHNMLTWLPQCTEGGKRTPRRRSGCASGGGRHRGLGSVSFPILYPTPCGSIIPLWTRKALWPLGIMWRVFLLEPYPICVATASAKVLSIKHHSTLFLHTRKLHFPSTQWRVVPWA